MKALSEQVQVSVSAPLVSRREAISCVACALGAAVLGACSEERGFAITEPEPDAFRLEGRDVIITLARVPAFGATTGSLVIGAQQLIVWKRGASDYRAFNNICTHSGCGISTVLTNRLLCQCHGSEFNDEGTNVAGPAPTPLTRYPVTLDEVAGTVRVTRA
jgi:Rieske Fe-S protein